MFNLQNARTQSGLVIACAPLTSSGDDGLGVRGRGAGIQRSPEKERSPDEPAGSIGASAPVVGRVSPSRALARFVKPPKRRK